MLSCSCGTSLNLRVNATTGAFLITGSGSPLESVQGVPPSIFVDKSWHGIGHGLTASGNAIAQGQDSIGRFTQIELQWRAGATPWITSFRCHDNGQLIFDQSFPQGINGSAGGVRDLDVPSTSFPTFNTTTWANAGLRLATFFGQNAARSTRSGPWPSSYRGGWLGGPLAFYRGKRGEVGPVVVLSALSHFTTVEHGLAQTELHFGLQGLLHSVPQGHRVSFIFSPLVVTDIEDMAGENAGRIASAFMRWGDTLLRYANGKRTAPDATTAITHLGYSTTGAYHYNPCDCPNNTVGSHCARGDSVRLPGCRTYEDTMLAIDADATSRGLPYAWWLIDSWWHAYDREGHAQSPTRFFEDVPDQVGSIFPSGLSSLYKSTRGRTYGAHWSSQFSDDSPYATIDPASWVCSSPSAARPRQCVPTSSRVWEHIFKADSSWGLRTIKIDHVFELFIGSNAGDPDCGHKDGSPCGPGERNATLSASGALLQALSSPTLVEAFVDGVGIAAAAQGVSILWCMSPPSVLMHSVADAAMTHGRGSADSHPHGTQYPRDNWMGFGGESTLLWALGLWPFKDTFYSNASATLENSHAEDGGTTGEPMPFTHALVSALSGGGVAAGGPVGTADSTLLHMTCRPDGMLLKPTAPATYIDRVWLNDVSVGETSAASTILDGHVWKFISIIRNAEYTLTTADVGLSTAAKNQYAAYLLCASRPLARPCLRSEPDVRPFQQDVGFAVPSSNWTEPDGAEAQLLVVAPLLSNGLILLGEEGKLVPVAANRFIGLEETSGVAVRTLTVEVRGVEHESISLLVADARAGYHIVRGICRFGPTGRLQMRFTISSGISPEALHGDFQCLELFEIA